MNTIDIVLAVTSFVALVASGIFNLRKGKHEDNSKRTTNGFLLLGCAVMIFLIYLFQLI